jgi:Uma2 family endonuclease
MSTARKTAEPPAEVEEGVTFDEYLRRRDDPDTYRVRMFYLDGMLERMSPGTAHEFGSEVFPPIVTAYCEAFDVRCVAAGSTTFRKGVRGRGRGAGAEPDKGFFIGPAADRVLRKKPEDVDVSRPPSLWVEVESTKSAVPRMRLYARLRVPKVWRYDVRKASVRFYLLKGDEYREADSSAALPGLTPAMVAEAVRRGESMDTVGFGRWLRNEWLPAHRRAMIAGGAGR